MFPYPSGLGLHVGHPKGYIATDIYSRYKKMQGFHVLHPMGFDSFGLTAEQYAIEHGVHPAVITEQNIDTIREQIQFLGLGYDWDREIATSRQDFYQWTQWMFQKFFESWFDFDQQKARPITELVKSFDSGKRQVEGQEWSILSAAEKSAVLNEYRIAYQKEVTVNWCPGLGTVLSNEEVSEMDVRLTEQFHGEEKNKVGSKVRGDEGLGVESSEEDKVSRLVWNLVNKGDCFLKLIDHPKILPLIQHII